MKKIVSLALIFALGFQFLMKLGIMTYFQLNRVYITEMFCENKDRPQLNCDGQCFLAKKLQAAEEKTSEKESTRTVNQQLEIPLFIISTPAFVSFIDEKPIMEIPTLIEHYSFLSSSTLFHPPKFIG